MNKLVKEVASHFFVYECLYCSKEVSSGVVLCFQCNRDMGEIDQSSACTKCGRYCLAETCYFCIHNPPFFTSARSFCVYNAQSSSVIKQFKYYNNRTSLHMISEKIHSLIKFFPNIDIITPVPMNIIKEYIKGYNHAGRIAKILATKSRTEFLPFLLKRKFSWKRQAISNRETRFQNIKNAFSCKRNLLDKSILLIDDAITTGATVNECSKVLFNAGARNVFVLTFAKSITDEIIFTRNTIV